MTVRGDRIPPFRTPWVLDNGSYRDWKLLEPFDRGAWRGALIAAAQVDPLPEWTIAPDVPGDWGATLSLSMRLLADIEEFLPGVPVYWALQDGVRRENVPWEVLDGVFVGGTNSWKFKMGGRIVEWAHDRGLPCHIGRVGTIAKVGWARRIGADSIDSSFPLRAKRNFWRFVQALEEQQGELAFDKET